MLETNHLSAGYGGNNILYDVSLTIPNGKLTAIVGANGSGKSTLLKTLCGMISAQKGQVFVDHEELNKIPRKILAQKVSLLSQTREVPEITANRLVMHGRFPWIGYPRIYSQKDCDIAETAMKRTGIFEKRAYKVAQLSGGERQKVYIAMCLAQNAGNILMDEPTTFLDISSQLELIKMIMSIKCEGKAVAAVFHDLRLALEFADLIAVMKKGRLIFAGTPNETVLSASLEEAFGIKLKRGTQYIFS